MAAAQASAGNRKDLIRECAEHLVAQQWSKLKAAVDTLSDCVRNTKTWLVGGMGTPEETFELSCLLVIKGLSAVANINCLAVRCCV